MKDIKSTMVLFVEEELISQTQADDAVSRMKMNTDLEELAADSDFITEAIVE